MYSKSQHQNGTDYSFEQAKLDMENVSTLLNRLEQLLDQSQLTFAIDHPKSYLLKMNTKSIGGGGGGVSVTTTTTAMNYYEQLRKEMVNETTREKKTLSGISETASFAIEQLKRLNDPLFLQYMELDETNNDTSSLKDITMLDHR
jgi:hypothetical protein